MQISSISGSDSSDGDDDNLGSMQGTSGPMISFISQGKILEMMLLFCAVSIMLKLYSSYTGCSNCGKYREHSFHPALFFYSHQTHGLTNLGAVISINFRRY